MALAEATPDELRARRRCSAATPGSTSCGSRPRHPARALRRRRRARHARLAGLPAAVGLRPPVRRQAVRQAAEAVDLLGHHPSIAVWCGHNEPVAIDVRRRHEPTARVDAGVRRRPAAADVEPHVLDRSVKRAFERADGTPAGRRPLRRGAPPAAARRHRQPPLLRLVLRRGARPAGLRRRRAPHGPLRGEFGAQAVPEDAAVHGARALARPRLGAAGRAPRPPAGRVRPARAAGRPTPPSTSGGTPRSATRPRVLRHQIEQLRRLKYRPDRRLRRQLAWPTPTPRSPGAVLGHDRAPKLATTPLGEACRPVIVVADRLPAARGARRRRSPSTSTSCRDRRVADRRRDVTARLSWAGRPPRLALAGRRRRPTPASASGTVVVRRARRAGRARPRPRPRRRRRGRQQPLQSVHRRRLMHRGGTIRKPRQVHASRSGSTAAARRFLNLAFR